MHLSVQGIKPLNTSELRAQAHAGSLGDSQNKTGKCRKKAPFFWTV